MQEVGRQMLSRYKWNMPSYLATLVSELIRFQSIDMPPYRAEVEEAVNWVEKRLKKLPGVFITRFSQNGKSSLVVTFERGLKKPTVFLNGHLDVVPGEKDQFQPQLKGKRLFGRGAHDMKGGCAVMMALIEYFSRQPRKPDVGFMFVTDEEFSGEDGSHMLLKKGYRADLLVTLEPTNLEIIVETKGMLWLEAAVPGKAAHGSMPWLGQNPVELFYEGLKKFYRDFPPPRRKIWQTTLNLGEVRSGDCYNRVPPDLTFKIDVRYLPEENPRKILKNIQRCFPRVTRWNVVRCDPPHKKAKNMTLIHRLKKTMGDIGIQAAYRRAPFCTDARFFSAAGMNCAVLGPAGANMHGKDEWVDIQSLEKLFEIFKNFLSRHLLHYHS